MKLTILSRMADFLQQIRLNSIDSALETLKSQRNRVSNAKTPDGSVSALMLASELTPPSKAIQLIDALVLNGASLNKRVEKRRHVILYACEAGVDPSIIDALLKWNKSKKNVIDRWWIHCDSNFNGVFILACSSLNFNLVEHILALASKEEAKRGENIL